MPTYDRLLENFVCGDYLDLERVIHSLPGSPAATVRLTIYDLDRSTVKVSKAITTAATVDGQITANPVHTLTTTAAVDAGATTIPVAALPTTIPAGAVIEFTGGARVITKQIAYQAAKSLVCQDNAPLEKPIANGETASHRTCECVIRLIGTETGALVPKRKYEYDVEVTCVSGAEFTPETGHFKGRKQITNP